MRKNRVKVYGSKRAFMQETAVYIAQNEAVVVVA